MLSAVRKRMTWANVAMTLALVFAMSGGAYAAKKFIITNTKQISPKVLAQLKGAKGPAGAPGAAGPQGPQGNPGTPGKDGTNGANGEKGANGTSATAKSFTGAKTLGSEKCTNGGLEVTSAGGTTLVCNGTNGQTGFTKTLPEKQTETGAWGFAGGKSPSFISHDEPIASFAIPISGPLAGSGCHTVAIPTGGSIVGPCQVHYIDPAGKELVEDKETEENVELTSTACPGNAEKPEAEPGNLCVYAGVFSSVGILSTSESIANPATGKAGAGRSGAVETFGGLGAEANGSGTWAVTAE